MYAKKLVLAAILRGRPAGQTAGQSPSIGFDGRPLDLVDVGRRRSIILSGWSLLLPSRVESAARCSDESAEVLATADNLFALYVNGQGVGESDTDNSAWSKPQRFDIAAASTRPQCRSGTSGQHARCRAGWLSQSAIRLANGQAIELPVTRPGSAV
ncbi:MAG: hypothetical protein R3C56_36070 [Pirellulaceae bacterium]